MRSIKSAEWIRPQCRRKEESPLNNACATRSSAGDPLQLFNRPPPSTRSTSFYEIQPRIKQKPGQRYMGIADCSVKPAGCYSLGD
ncbi:hypothetical protein ALC57_03457 [Trachymyrmex cornetzi]|uniref:Uncharacterized protein n=1 Tax=Trachymyrmex cornetzi TaxID=471704 RepID=A0A195EGV9_9HYME|nr:hypothetical protein ALC57_03457 [Trachymyrmex cornetzi]